MSLANELAVPLAILSVFLVAGFMLLARFLIDRESFEEEVTLTAVFDVDAGLAYRQRFPLFRPCDIPALLGDYGGPDHVVPGPQAIVEPLAELPGAPSLGADGPGANLQDHVDTVQANIYQQVVEAEPFLVVIPPDPYPDSDEDDAEEVDQVPAGNVAEFGLLDTGLANRAAFGTVMQFHEPAASKEQALR